jgi:hypothetical protein
LSHEQLSSAIRLLGEQVAPMVKEKLGTPGEKVAGRMSV